jgi:hypothetical protein
VLHSPRRRLRLVYNPILNQVTVTVTRFTYCAIFGLCGTSLYVIILCSHMLAVEPRNVTTNVARAISILATFSLLKTFLISASGEKEPLLQCYLYCKTLALIYSWYTSDAQKNPLPGTAARGSIPGEQSPTMP